MNYELRIMNYELRIFNFFKQFFIFFMKKTLLLIGVVFLFSLTSNAQKKDYAFFDIEQIFAVMPEAERAQALYEKEQTDVMQIFEEMQVEFNNLYQDFTNDQELDKNDPEKWSKIKADDKQIELMQIQERMQKFQMTAQEDLQTRQLELLTPVYNKIDSAVGVVVKDKGYPFAMNKADVYYINEDKCDDITSLIKKALGLLE